MFQPRYSVFRIPCRAESFQIGSKLGCGLAAYVTIFFKRLADDLFELPAARRD